MSDVFVSYKAEDRRRVRPLVEALEAEGYSVWWDEQIGGGSQWRHMIESELNAAKCVVVAWSKRSVGVDGIFVQDEATRAQQRHVYVPVTIDKVNLPLGFGETQALPLTGWRGNRSDPRYRAVLASVQRICGEARGAPPTQVEGGIDRRTVVAGGAVEAAAIAGAAVWLLKPTAASASKSIAVLPFANLSGDPAKAYFSDGMAEELRSALSRIAGLEVVGRTSSEAVRDKDAQTAAKALRVENVLTGSVRESPSMIRVGAQLVDGKTGVERWSETYDRKPGDSIGIQSDIAASVAQSLSATLGKQARDALSVGGTSNADAQRLYFQSIELTRSFTLEGVRRAMTLLDQAIALDPNYAAAYAQKSFVEDVYSTSLAGSVDELFEYRARSMRSAKKALKLAPNLGSAHRALAENYRSVLKLDSAAAEYRRAIELSPSEPGQLLGYATLRAFLGFPAEALRLSKAGEERDPLNPIVSLNRSIVLFAGRKFVELIRYAKEAEQISKAKFRSPEIIGFAYLALERYPEARAYLDQADSNAYNRIVGDAIYLQRTGKSDQVPEQIAKLQSNHGEAASYQFAQIYAQIGDKERAFAALERAWEIKDAGLQRLKTDIFMDPVRADRRFNPMMKRVGLIT